MRPELRDYITESNKAVKEIESKGFLYQGWNIDTDKVCCSKDGQYFYADNAISLLKLLKNTKHLGRYLYFKTIRISNVWTRGTFNRPDTNNVNLFKNKKR